MKSSLRNQQIPTSNSAVISLCFLIMLYLIVQRENYKKSTHHHSQINAAFPLLKNVLFFFALPKNDRFFLRKSEHALKGGVWPKA